MKSQKGFTLIELVAVIVILGILAATAIPKFVDMQASAGNAAAQGTGGAIASGSALNYASSAAGGTATAVTSTTACTGLSALLGSGLPSGHTLGGTLSCAGAGGAGTGCTVTASQGTAQSFTVVCTGS